MRKFEIVDSEGKFPDIPCAVLSCDQGSDSFSAEVEEWAGPGDVPVQFSPFVEKGQRHIPEKWVYAWIDERVAPPARQNIGEVLKEHGLDRYDACELLVSSAGRSSQDGFYLREVTETFKGAAQLGRVLAQARAAVGLTQCDLAKRSGIKQEVISRIERGKANPTMKTLERLAEALGKKLVLRFD